MDVRHVGARIRSRRRILSREPVTIAAVQDPAAPSEQELDELYDNPLERLQLLGEDDAAIAAFLDEIDVRGPRDREMLRELARTSALARPEQFEDDHRRVLVGLESLRRHGYHGSTAGSGVPVLGTPIRFLVELVARYVVVSHVKNIAMNLRNLYWLREMQSQPRSRELASLFKARTDAQALVDITKSREIGVPAFVRLGKQAREDGATQSDNVVGDVVEALIGALFLDGGLEAAEQFILRQWEPDLAIQGRAPQHPKSALQELAASRQVKAPTYEVVERTGAHHAPKFTVRVSVPKIGEATAEGASKQEAETAAAAALLDQLK